MLTNDSPIIACSTGFNSNTAISIIRLSGFSDLSLLNQFFSIDLFNLKARYATNSNITYNGKIIDDILLLYFPNPNSYTGENLLELHCHGNLLNIQRILDLFTKNNDFKLAKPGEFTYRALKNKKMSFSQVEGLESFLNAKSSLMLDEGLSLLNGKLKEEYLVLYKLFLNFKSSMDMLTDFSEDVGDEIAFKNLGESFSFLKNAINKLNYRAKIEVDFLKQAKICIFGKTNAGKSSLFNLILGEDRSIISSIAGTTRDYISEYINLNDLYFELIDTAGIRDTKDEIEQNGIEKAKKLLNHSFYKILVIDPNDFFDFSLNSEFDVEYDLIVLSHLDMLNKFEKINKFKFKKILFANLSLESGSIGPKNNDKYSGPIGAVVNSGSIGPDQIIYNFSKLSDDICNKFISISSKSPIINKRHRLVINNLNNLSNEFSENFENGDMGILSFYSQKFSYEISDLIGYVDSEKSVNNIFDNFCIGK